MGMYPSLGVSATGLAAQRLRMDVIANNLANVDSTTGVGEAYRRKVLVMSEAPTDSGFRIPRLSGDASAGFPRLAGFICTRQALSSSIVSATGS